MNTIRIEVNLDQLNDLALTIRSAKFGRDASDPMVEKINDIALEVCDVISCGVSSLSRFNRVGFLNTCGVKQ